MKCIIIVQQYVKHDIQLEMQLLGFRGIEHVETVKVEMTGSKSVSWIWVLATTPSHVCMRVGYDCNGPDQGRERGRGARGTGDVSACW